MLEGPCIKESLITLINGIWDGCVGLNTLTKEANEFSGVFHNSEVGQLPCSQGIVYIV